MGIAGRTFSRWACRYALLFCDGVMGNAGVLAGRRAGGAGNLLGVGLGDSSDGVVVLWDWMGRVSDSPLDSVMLRFRGGTLNSLVSLLRSTRVHFAAARVAGATEKRRPICTVALLSVLSPRRCFSPNMGRGFMRKSNASVTLVMELRRVKRRRASLETLESPGTAFGL